MPRFNFNDGSYYDFERFTTLNRNTTNRWGQVAYVYYFSENEAKNAGYVTIPENILTPLSAKVRDWSYHHYGYNKTQAIKNAVEEYDKGEVIPGQPNPYIVTAGLICHRQNFSGLPEGIYVPIQIMTPNLAAKWSTITGGAPYLFTDLDNLTGDIIYEDRFINCTTRKKQQRKNLDEKK